MSEATNSVAIASISAGNTQIVLFAMLIVFVIMVIWFTKMCGRMMDSWWIPFPTVKIPDMSEKKTSPLVEKEKIETPEMSEKKTSPLVEKEKIETPEISAKHEGFVMCDVDMLERPTCVENKRLTFSECLDHHGVRKSLSHIDAINDRLYDAIKRIDELEVVTKTAAHEKKVAEEKLVKEKQLREDVEKRINALEVEMAEDVKKSINACVVVLFG